MSVNLDSKIQIDIHYRRNMRIKCANSFNEMFDTIRMEKGYQFIIQFYTGNGFEKHFESYNNLNDVNRQLIFNSIIKMPVYRLLFSDIVVTTKRFCSRYFFDFHTPFFDTFKLVCDKHVKCDLLCDFEKEAIIDKALTYTLEDYFNEDR